MSGTPETGPLGAPAKKKSGGMLTGLVVLLVLAVLGGGAAYSYFFIWKGVAQTDQFRNIQAGLAGPEGLSSDYTDDNKDLVADPPPEDQQLDPPVLRFATLESRDKRDRVWKGFIAELSEKTGKTVVLVDPPSGSRGGAAALRAAWEEDKLLAGKGRKKKKLSDKERTGIHVAAFNTGTVPRAVNEGGFVPICLPADKEGKAGYKMEVLVPAGSSVQKLADLRGKTLTLGSLSSLSSARLPILKLYQDLQWLPGRDYQFLFLSGQRDAIQGVHEGRYPVAFVASDLLARLRRDKKLGLDASRVRTIYTSEKSYPPVSFGHVHYLKKELADQIREVFLTYKWDAELQKEFARAGQVRFARVDYQKDFASVREVDEALREMIKAHE